MGSSLDDPTYPLPGRGRPSWRGRWFRDGPSGPPQPRASVGSVSPLVEEGVLRPSRDRADRPTPWDRAWMIRRTRSPVEADPRGGGAGFVTGLAALLNHGRRSGRSLRWSRRAFYARHETARIDPRHGIEPG